MIYSIIFIIINMCMKWTFFIEWNKYLTSCPDFTEETVKQYLLDLKVLPKSERRHYKISRPYQLLPEVHSVYFRDLPESETFCALKVSLTYLKIT